MRLLTVVSECFPYVKTGGLADVASALPRALAALGHDVVTLLPGYPAVLGMLGDASAIDVYDELFGGPARVLDAGSHAGPRLLVVDAPHLFDRLGHPYFGPDLREWGDNPLRYGGLAVVAREIALGRLDGWRPDLVHAHDWQAGLVPAYLALDGRRRPATVMTVHNLAFQGQFAPEWVQPLGLPPSAFALAGVEYYGGLGFLKAGLYYADKLTTVSPSYAREIQTVEGGMGLGGLLAGRRADLVGIVNGIDADVWNPANDPHLPVGFDVDRLETRAVLKGMLQREFGLAERDDQLLFCVVSRLTWQKGIDLLVAALPALIDAGGQLALLVTGDPDLETAFLDAATRHPGRVATRIGYDEGLTHRLQAGSDAVILPSRFEPCGLTQLYGLRYGCVPLVARAGGLVDTVVDADEPDGNGLVFESGRTDRLIDAIRRAVDLWRDQRRRWRHLQTTGMTLELSWGRPARAYEHVFEAALASRS